MAGAAPAGQRLTAAAARGCLIRVPPPPSPRRRAGGGAGAGPANGGATLPSARSHWRGRDGFAWPSRRSAVWRHCAERPCAAAGGRWRGGGGVMAGRGGTRGSPQPPAPGHTGTGRASTQGDVQSPSLGRAARQPGSGAPLLGGETGDRWGKRPARGKVTGFPGYVAARGAYEGSEEKGHSVPSEIGRCSCSKIAVERDIETECVWGEVRDSWKLAVSREMLLARFEWPTPVTLHQAPLLPATRHKPVHVLLSSLLMLSLLNEYEEKAEDSAQHRDVAGCDVSGVWHRPALLKDSGAGASWDGLRVPWSRRGEERRGEEGTSPRSGRRRLSGEAAGVIRAGGRAKGRAGGMDV